MKIYLKGKLHRFLYMDGSPTTIPSRRIYIESPYLERTLVLDKPERGRNWRVNLEGCIPIYETPSLVKALIFYFFKRSVLVEIKSPPKTIFDELLKEISK